MGEQDGIYIDREGFDSWYREMRRVKTGLRDGLFEGEELAVGRDWRLTGAVKLQETIGNTVSNAQKAILALRSDVQDLIDAGLAIVEKAEWEDSLHADALRSIAIHRNSDV